MSEFIQQVFLGYVLCARNIKLTRESILLARSTPSHRKTHINHVIIPKDIWRVVTSHLQQRLLAFIYVQVSFPSSLIRGLPFCPLVVRQCNTTCQWAENGNSHGHLWAKTCNCQHDTLNTLFLCHIDREAKTSGWYNYRMVKPLLAPSRKSLWGAAHENDPDIKQTDQRMNLC